MESIKENYEMMFTSYPDLVDITQLKEMLGIGITLAYRLVRNKTIKGVGWSAADALLGQGVTFVTGLVLARLLSPEEYGLVGICLIFTTILNGIVDSGFSNALIRKKDTTNEDYNTMFITNLGISIVLYVLLFFASFNSVFLLAFNMLPYFIASSTVIPVNG